MVIPGNGIIKFPELAHFLGPSIKRTVRLGSNHAIGEKKEVYKKTHFLVHIQSIKSHSGVLCQDQSYSEAQDRDNNRRIIHKLYSPEAASEES